ncbi:MAG: ATP-binding protein, partial [Desulfuromonadaceae bacterium]
ARALSSKDVVYRRWGGSFGGIYVNLNSGVQPNHLLTTHPQRDVVTDSGTRLTMINHEYMSQMVYDLEDQSQGIKTALISLNPLNPLNRPSTFETAALQQLREGRKDVSLIEQNETGRFLRLITPLRTEKNCLQCHRNNGFVLDEVCCGLSVTVPMAPYEQQAATELFNSAIAHSLIWLFGLLAITVGFKQFHRSEQARRKTEDELIWAKIKAEDASRAKGDFLANMSHEVRTPMNSIIGMTELVLDSPLSRYQQDCLETVKYSADSLLELINDILDFSKLEAGMLEYEQVPFNLPLLVEEAMRSLAVPAQKKGLEIAFWVAETVPVEMTGDPQRLKQILLNLLSNAVKFTERGRVVLGVSMDADVLASARVSFAVEDTGIGIPEDFQDKLFSSYAQAEASTSRKFGGSGLGLAISKALAEGMGGTIRLQSQVGEGTTLNLRRLGAEVGTIDSGDSAVQMLHEARFRQVPYDGAIIDYHMPGLDGFSTVEILREHIDPQLPVIMMFTAKELGQAIDRCNEYKIDDYLVKPVSLGQLQQSLSVLFNPRIKTTEREPDEKRESVQLSSGTRQFHLLLAEDNPFNQKLTTA